MQQISVPGVGDSTHETQFFETGILAGRFLSLLQEEMLEGVVPLLRLHGSEPTIFSVVNPRSNEYEKLKQLDEVELRFPALRLCVDLVLQNVEYPKASMYEVALLGYRENDALAPHIDRRNEIVSVFNILGMGLYRRYNRGLFGRHQLKLSFGDARLVEKDAWLVEPGSLVVTNGDCEPEDREPHSMVSLSDPRFALVIRQVVKHELLVPGTTDFATAQRDGMQAQSQTR